MNDFLYRVDRLTKLQKISDGGFRARRWPNGSGDIPHKALKSASSKTPAGLFIYRICFWTSYDIAFNSLKKDYCFWGDGVISRVSKLKLDELYFNETWDDGFNQGEAYLFWKYDKALLSDTSLSESAIHLTDVEIFCEGIWRPFKNAVLPL